MDFELTSNRFRSVVMDEDIHWQHYELAESKANSPTALLLHGLGDHIGCHDWAARLLAKAGWNSIGFDWPGHGKSSGKRGDIHDVDSAAKLIDEVLEQFSADIVVGGVYAHSTGGFLLLRKLQKVTGQACPFANQIEWIWLNSPLLHPAHNQSSVKRMAARFLADWAPTLSVTTGVRASQCCNVKGKSPREICRLFGRSHSRVTMRFGQSLIENEELLFAEGFSFLEGKAFLISQGAEDSICPPALAWEFFQKLPAEKKAFLLLQGLRHEGFREERSEGLIYSVTTWLRNREPGFLKSLRD